MTPAHHETEDRRLPKWLGIAAALWPLTILVLYLSFNSTYFREMLRIFSAFVFGDRG